MRIWVRAYVTTPATPDDLYQLALNLAIVTERMRGKIWKFLTWFKSPGPPPTSFTLVYQYLSGGAWVTDGVVTVRP